MLLQLSGLQLNFASMRPICLDSAEATLVVRGERDPMVPQRWAEEAVALLPRGKLIVIPDAAHSIVYFASCQLAQVVRLFLLEDEAEPAGASLPSNL